MNSESIFPMILWNASENAKLTLSIVGNREDGGDGRQDDLLILSQFVVSDYFGKVLESDEGRENRLKKEKNRFKEAILDHVRIL